MPDSLVGRAQLRLGALLGDLHGPAVQVSVHQNAVGSSSVHQNYRQPGRPYWLGDSASIMATAAPTSLVAVNASEVRIIWGQGETDASFGVPRDDDAYYTVSVFDQIRSLVFKSRVEVFLVAPGRIETPPPARDAIDNVRDAYTQLDGFDNGAVACRIVAHHYDLPHVDPIHLSEPGYVTLAERIGEGIADPTLSTTITASAIAGQMIKLTTSELLAGGVGSPDLFELTINGTAYPSWVWSFGLSVYLLPVAGSPSLATATSVTLRHIPGRGLGLFGWTQSPIVSARGAPLTQDSSSCASAANRETVTP